jgi:hypothetical protein
VVAEWWLLDEDTQDAIAKRIDAAAASVLAHFDLHGNENSLTAALGQALLTTHIDVPGTSVRFTYRNFPEQTEEATTGADGGIVVTIRGPSDIVKKAVLFQAKRFAQQRSVRSLTLPRAEARRLCRQLDQMVPITDECIVLAHTRERVYAIDGSTANDLSIQDAQHIMEYARLVTIGTYLGKWVARCSRGDTGAYVVGRVEQPGGFLRHIIGIDIHTAQPPQLTAGGVRIDPVTHREPIPTPRWRRT